MSDGTTPARRIRNRIDWRHRLARMRGSATVLDLQRYDDSIEVLSKLEGDVEALPDHALTESARALRAAVQAGTPTIEVRHHLFALTREAARRALGQRPFDEQMVAALALSDGAIVEMQTGEGKTLAGVMPAALLALSGHGVHVLTFNDYLARRDAEWMTPVYHALGLSVGVVQQGTTPRDRRAAYRAEVTYLTAKEAGFDLLRDRLATRPEDVVHRAFHAALVDEADSLLIDEARVPLVIAGAVGSTGPALAHLAALVSDLTPGVHFDLDEYARDVELTEAGVDHVERVLASGRLHDAANYTLLTRLNCALHARALLHRDVDYIVRGGRIELVDDATGRVVHDRHWPDGLQAALEAKEGLAASDGGRIFGSTTLQHFLRGYSHLCGMTGTARDASDELHATYGTPVVVVPTHRPARRIDYPDLWFTHRDAKERAVAGEIQRAHRSGRPVLVGTRSVAESERLARRLESDGVPCTVLNARHDAEEAQIVALAGTLGSVTISTNMAGRGTDIRLGGDDASERSRVAALGGLYVIGTNRHESRRIDQQLRGRAGRQGDPGASRFFVSLDDDLLVRFGVDRLIPPSVRPTVQDTPIDHPIVRHEAARIQRIVEGQDLDIRRTLERYSTILEEQYERFGERRQAVLHGARPGIWLRAPAKRAALVAAAGARAVDEAERVVTLAHRDRIWSEHLARCADIREGIHLVRLGGQDPLTRFATEITEAFTPLEDEVDAAVLASLEHVRASDGAIDLEEAGVTRPSSTWTYLINDDPFKDQAMLRLAGAGGVTIAIYAAAMLPFLLVGWGLIDRFLRRQGARRPPTHGA